MAKKITSKDVASKASAALRADVLPIEQKV